MPQVHEVYLGLRSRVFAARPEDLGIVPGPEVPRVWAALMEWWQGDVPVTLLCVVDGTTSLYLGTGGGRLGAGNHPTVAGAARSFLDAAQSALAQMQSTTDHPLPSPGNIRFYALAFDGTYTAERPEEALVSGRDHLSPVFGAGSYVLEQIRRLDEGHPR